MLLNIVGAGFAPLFVSSSTGTAKVLLRDMTTDIEQQYIRKALKKSHGNIGRCARICGLSRRSISAKLTEYDIKKEDFKLDEP